MRRSVIAYSMCIGALLGCAPSPAPPPRAPAPPGQGGAGSGSEGIKVAGDCRVAKGNVDGVEVLMVTHERAGVGLVLPPLPSLELDCSAELGKKQPGLVLMAEFKQADTVVALLSETSQEVLSEKRFLEYVGTRYAKRAVEELKATTREVSVDGLPGAMIATVVADVPTPEGPSVHSMQLVNVRQRASDKRAFLLVVSVGDPTPDDRALWRSFLTMPANPVLRNAGGETLAPGVPKKP